jgi:Lon protease-like protein
MVDDALKAEGVFGMIQPVVPQRDNRPLPGAEKETPDLYSVGCAGHIESWEQSPDGRYIIQLRGINRFRSGDELPPVRGYRRVKADYREFPDSTIEQDWRCDRLTVTRALQEYCRTSGLRLQPDQVDRLADIELVNLLGVSLPFHPAEKQALLEAPSLKDREAVLLDLLRLGTGPVDPGTDIPPRTIN